MLARRTLTIPTALVLAALACAGCGRRGALEPPDGAAPTSRPATASSGDAFRASPRALPQSVGLGLGSASSDPDAVRAGDELPASATPATSGEVPIQTSRGAKRGYVIPKEPFILDPLL